MRQESPPSSSPASLADYFKTTSPAIAAALIAANQLQYSHCELHRNNKDVIFFFEDPHHVGDDLQRSYAAGTFPLVHAKMLTDARSYLAQENKRIKQGGGYAKG